MDKKLEITILYHEFNLLSVSKVFFRVKRRNEKLCLYFFIFL